MLVSFARKHGLERMTVEDFVETVFFKLAYEFRRDDRGLQPSIRYLTTRHSAWIGTAAPDPRGLQLSTLYEAVVATHSSETSRSKGVDGPLYRTPKAADAAGHAKALSRAGAPRFLCRCEDDRRGADEPVGYAGLARGISRRPES